MAAPGRYCLLLNEDSELTPGAADALRARARAEPARRAPQARASSTRTAWRSRRRGAFPGVAAALGRRRVPHRPPDRPEPRRSVREVDWVQSAGMLVRREAFEQVGPLDPDFFVYSDEVDWQRRARDAGWSVLYVPARRSCTASSSPTDAGPRRIVEFSRNRDRYMRKHRGGAAALAVRVLTAWTPTRCARWPRWCCPDTQPAALLVARLPFALPRPRRGPARGRRGLQPRTAQRRPTVKSHTVYRTFQTPQRREFVRITEDVQEAVDEAGIAEGMALVSAMHITAGVWVNDDEPGILEDALEWLDKLAPPSWRDPPTTSRASSCRTAATTATTAAARTTATRT